MRKLLSVSLKLVGAVALAAIIWVGYLVYSLGQPVKAFEITQGKAGEFILGETKDALLARLPEQEYAVGPDAGTCGTTWIEVKSMSPWQRQCLLGAQQWEAGTGIQALCPERTDYFATLYFSDRKLVKVGIRCTHPE